MKTVAGVSLYGYQMDAVGRLSNGKILCGGVGSGKSRTALAYYYILNGGQVNMGKYVKMKPKPLDLYIITTARKRDTLEWERELLPFMICKDDNGKIYDHKVVIDSWNNVKKYCDCENAFFIFDEQRVIGNGVWVKSFWKITKKNQWLLLSATPGDTWLDYIPVFVANGFYRNRSEFIREHVIYSSYTKFKKVDRYVGTGRLIRLRNLILVNMDFERQTVSHHEDIYVSYNRALYKEVGKTRWNIWENRPLRNAADYCSALRKIVNSDQSRQTRVLELLVTHPKAIIFYNYDYELDILRNLNYGNGTEIAEWNGHKHQPIPDSDKWVYLVQYNAGAEGWNCVLTDTIIFYSQNYSYRIMTQSSGRIDRLNTPYTDLYYYHLKTYSGIDRAIDAALRNKKKFNEGRFYYSEKGET